MKLQNQDLSEVSQGDNVSHRVHGRITTPGGRPAAGVPVRAFDRNLRSERLLGEATTDAQGNYEIRYSLQPLGKERADLVVRTLPKKAPQVDSPILFDAQPDEAVDLTVTLPEPSEYESLVQEIEPLCEGVPIAELREDEEHHDVSFLTGETGQGEMRIAFLILAQRLAKETNLPAEAFYGLFREGMPTSLAALQGKAAVHLQAALRAAAQKRIIPPRFAKESRKIAGALAVPRAADTLPEAQPTAAFAARLQADPQLGKSPAAQFLASHPDVDLRTARLETLLGEGEEDLKRELQGVQRLFKVAPGFDEVKALLDAGVDSAHAIAAQSRNAFVEKHAATLGAARAGRIHEQASQVSATALALLAEHAPAFRGAGLAVLADEAAALARVPDWETLFGSGDFCDCEDCRSVHSPAAYLVDVLDFLKNRDTGGTSARTVLFQRRADLGEIELTCENTNTPLPYVDLVNEILESAVAPATAIPPRRRQTTGTAAELAANPQHVNPAAYTELRTAVFPWSLPFDLWLEESRTYLGHLGVARPQLMETFRTTAPTDLATNLDIAGERLGFSVQERKIVAGEALTPAVDPWELYGFSDAESATWVDTVSRVRTFLDRAGLLYEELDRLLELRFINPNGTIVIEPEDPKEPCNMQKLRLRNLDAAALDRIHRFVRLWRRTGWPMRDLDRAIALLRAGKIEKELLIELAALQRLAAEIDLPVVRLLAFYAPLDTYFYAGRADDKPLYDQLFLNPAVLKLDPGEASPFALKADRSELAVIGRLEDKKVAAALPGALGLTDEELAALVSGPDAVVTAGKELNRANLTRLARAVFLAWALRLRIADFLRLLKLSKDDPFTLASPLDPAVPARTLAFIATAGHLAESGFTIAEVDLLLGGRTDPASPATPPDEALARVLEEVRAAVRKAPPGTPDRNLEALALEKVGSALGLDPATGQALLRTWLLSPTHAGQPALLDLTAPGFIGSDTPVTRGAFPEPMAALSLAYRVAFVLARLRIGARQLPWSLGRAASAGWLDLNALPLAAIDPAARFETWTRLLDLVRLRDRVRGGEALLTRIFALAYGGATSDALAQALAEETAWRRGDVDFLIGSQGFNLTLPDAFKNEQALLRLQAAFSLLGRLGVSAERAMASKRPDPQQEDARGALQAARARHEEKDWLQVAGPLRNAIRERQRASLVAYLVARPGAGPTWTDANGLYQFFLIDVEMSPCQLTARIKQAISSVQLFVQRCLMNLESAVKADTAVDIGWQDWKWMKNYRVWEAGRKVFLYPENWVEPDLRDDKSPFCIELENELLQRELTDETAEEAYLNYLEKLDAVARLDVQGVYHQLERDEHGNVTVDILHVFARTRHTPHIHYYRTRVGGYRWMAWEKIDLDIEGDHLMPIVWNRRLHLFWAVFTLESEAQEITVPAAGGKVSEPYKYWRIQLAWSERKNGKWQPKKLTLESLESFHSQPPPALQGLRFRTRVLPEGPLEIQAHDIRFISGEEEWWGAYLGRFVFTGCNGEVYTVTPSRPTVPTLVFPKRIQVWGMELIEESATAEPLYLGTDDSASALAHTPPEGSGRFRLLLSPDRFFRAVGGSDPEGDLFEKPFFFSDAERTLFVAPLGISAPVAPLRREGGPAGETGIVRIDPPAGPVKTQGLSQLMPPPPRDRQGRTALAVARALAGGTTLAARLLTETAERLEAAAPPGPFRLYTFHHPYVCLFIREVNRLGLDGLLRREIQINPDLLAGRPPFNFAAAYSPTALITAPYPAEEIDFAWQGSYALYNWELFFYIPLTIAVRLSKNQRFEEAERWFHSIFDPTDTSSFPTPQRFWRTRPFFLAADPDYAAQRIEALLEKLASGTPDEDLAQSVRDWRKNPFNPHAVARLRTTAYQKAVVMKYLDHLIAWGDQLFRRDTLESLNEATQIYVLAAEILGRRPERVTVRGTASPKTYNDIDSRPFAPLSGALAAAELLVPAAGEEALAGLEAVPPLPRFYLSDFCVPKNDKLLGYWDLLADRLFKLRHCMNIEGVERQLALFEPPIDPALLVRAAAAGLDLGSVLADLDAALPRYRFNTMAAKAGELCSEVKALGGALLAALEKRDAEALSLLRSAQEIRVLEAARQVRQRQIDEASETVAGLQRSRELAVIKRQYYTSRDFLNVGETGHLVLATNALAVQSAAAALDLTASILHLIPNFKIGSPFSIGVTYGGSDVGSSLKGLAGSLGLVAGVLSSTGSLAATLGGYERRADEWKLQADLATQEIAQIDRQIAAAQVRVAIAERELDNHDLQVENAKQTESFLRDKFTNRELYDWMVSQISGVYFQAYQLAYDVAKRAEQAYRFELAADGSSFIRFGYWDSLKKGLLAGEKLYLDLKRMEVAYLDQNRREYEITQRISLAELDPLAILNLRTTGECFISLPEALFDLRAPGHYLRRLKSVGLTIPCVTGPYTGVHCTLTLLTSSLRRDATLPSNKYARQPGDTRFKDSSGAVQSIVTSGGTEDAGLFETSLRDERYLPFEGAGAISNWHLKFPASLRSLDYDTISDVVLHLRYTAREGGATLRDQAVAELLQALNTLLLAESRTGLYLRVSARHDFPGEWARFMSPTGTNDQVLSLDLAKDGFPFLVRDRKVTVNGVQVLLQLSDGKTPAGTSTWIESYAAKDPLKVALAPPVGTAKNGDLASSSTVLAGMPSLNFTIAQEVGTPSRWTLTATRSDIAKISADVRTPDNRLAPAVVEDLHLVLHYTIA